MSERVWLAIAAAFMLVGIVWLFEGRLFVAYGVETQGAVVSYEEVTRRTDDRSTHKAYREVVGYQVGSESFTYTSRDDYVTRPRIGSSRILYYRQSKPSKARLEKELTGLGGGAFGAFVLIGIGLFFGYRGLPTLLASLPNEPSRDSASNSSPPKD